MTGACQLMMSSMVLASSLDELLTDRVGLRGRVGRSVRSLAQVELLGISVFIRETKETKDGGREPKHERFSTKY